MLDWLVVGDVGVELRQERSGTRRILGGAAARLAAQGAAHGARVAMVGKVGSDREGAAIVETLRDGGVDVRWLIQQPASQTTVWQERAARPQGRRVQRGADMMLRLDEVPSAAAARAALTLVSGYSLSVEPGRSAVMGALTRARDSGSLAAIQLEAELLWWTNSRITRKVLEPALSAARVASLTATDARVLFGERQDPKESLLGLARMGPSVVFMAAEAGGAFLHAAGRSQVLAADHQPAGGADPFALPAKFLLELARGRSPRSAAVTAVGAGRRKPLAAIRL